MAAILTKLEWIKDENGNYRYDEQAINKFYAKQKRQMERQNAKIAASPKLQKDYSICDADEFARSMVEMYKHNFRLYTEVVK